MSRVKSARRGLVENESENPRNRTSDEVSVLRQKQIKTNIEKGTVISRKRKGKNDKGVVSIGGRLTFGKPRG